MVQPCAYHEGTREPGAHLLQDGWTPFILTFDNLGTFNGDTEQASSTGWNPEHTAFIAMCLEGLDDLFEQLVEHRLPNSSAGLKVYAAAAKPAEDWADDGRPIDGTTLRPQALIGTFDAGKFREKFPELYQKLNVFFPAHPDGETKLKLVPAL